MGSGLQSGQLVHSRLSGNDLVSRIRAGIQTEDDVQAVLKAIVRASTVNGPNAIEDALGLVSGWQKAVRRDADAALIDHVGRSTTRDSIPARHRALVEYRERHFAFDFARGWVKPGKTAPMYFYLLGRGGRVPDLSTFRREIAACGKTPEK